MLQEFQIYLQLGFEHILDWQGYDHMLFILALCGGYTFSQWKDVLVLITAFTVGHSITLALSALDLFRLDDGLIEFLIPLTILLTGLYHWLSANQHVEKQVSRWEYGLALGFGCIHGMGFSNYFRALMLDSASVLKPLLFFNIGIEIGQIVFVLLALGVATLALRFTNLPHSAWNRVISGLVILAALYLMLI